MNLPKVTTIGDYCFYYCTSLTSVNLPKVTTIGDYCFSHCTSLTTIYLPLITSLGSTIGNDLVFNNMIGNTIDLTIPSSLQPDGDIIYLTSNNTVNVITV